jgi:hypothetical protein
MAQVRVWNDNVHPYEEIFKGDKLLIGSKDFIEMDENEAVQFKGTFKPPVLNVDGVHLPEGFKMIRVEKIQDHPSVVKADDSLQCNACKYKASSKADFDEHSKTHAEHVLVDEVAEAEIKARKMRSK